MELVKIRDGQKFALLKLCQKYTKSRGCRLWILSELLGKSVESTEELSLQDWRRIRDEAYPDWHNDDWLTSKEFDSKMRGLVFRYEKEVLGQMGLFNE